MEIEKKFLKSATNQNYRFPGLDRVEDNESSLGELEDIEACDLRRQNDDRELDEVEQLVELFYVVGRLEKQEIRELLV